MKEFCIAGPIQPVKNYYLPKRLDWNRFDSYINSGFYVVLHAPRQSGKTSGIKEYINYLNAKEIYTAFYLSFEPGHKKPTVEQTFIAILENCQRGLRLQLPEEKKVLNYITTLLKSKPFPENAFLDFLTFWSQESAKQLILFFDEVDGLTGEPLISFFKQVRTGFPDRPGDFPHSMVLIGLRDLRDYKVKSRQESNQNSDDSPFNITAESIRLADFTKEEIAALYSQHTEATGQIFTQDAIEFAFQLTQGQPWLVNAIAFEACFRDVTDRTKPITVEVVERAKRTLILRRDTHLDALYHRLHDKRVRTIIDAIISGKASEPFSIEDIQYTRDLGLIKQDEFRIANPIYQEVIPRELTYVMQSMLPEKTLFYLNESGDLDMHKLFERFTQFYRENSYDMLKNNDYKESGPHFVLMAWLQRIVNGGGDVRREYAYGNKHLDLLVTWKEQRIVIEVKLSYGAHTVPEGVAQTAKYMDISKGAEGHLVVFDRDPHKSWDEKISSSVEQFENKTIHVWQM